METIGFYSYQSDDFSITEKISEIRNSGVRILLVNFSLLQNDPLKVLTAIEAFGEIGLILKSTTSKDQSLMPPMENFQSSSLRPVTNTLEEL